MLKHIDSNKISLDDLNSKNSWIPSFDQVRRSNLIEDKYQEFINDELSKFESKEDYIIKKIFNNIGSKFVLSENLFPYQVNVGTYHYIMWYLEKIDDDDKVTLNIVSEFIRLKLYKENLEFVWYENPKISGDLYHVHVFFHYK
jgi:hypothetical protein